MPTLHDLAGADRLELEIGWQYAMCDDPKRLQRVIGLILILYTNGGSNIIVSMNLPNVLKFCAFFNCNVFYYFNQWMDKQGQEPS